MELYIDVIFLVSWGMHTFLLWAAGKIAGFSAKRRRLLLGGCLTAFLYCLCLCFWGKGGCLLSFLLLVSGLFSAYYPKRGRNMLRLWTSALAASFLMAGCVNVLFTLTQAQRLFGRGLIIQQSYPWWLLPWSVGMAFIALKLAGKWLEVNIQRRKEYCTIKILFRRKGVEGRVLIDTGNGLREGKRGVPVLQLSAILPLFSGMEQIALLGGKRDCLEWISYTSLGNPNGRLYGIRAEKVLLFLGENCIIHKDIFVGINEGEFTGAYEGIVPPCLLEEE